MKKAAIKFGRRDMIRSVGATMALGALGALCPQRLWGASSKYQLTDIRVPMAPDNPAVLFDAAKCVQCGQCKTVCARMMSVSGFYDLAKSGDVPVCVNCGQCTSVCEGLALVNRPEWQAVKAAEEFGAAPGTFCEGEVVAALRALGADYVLDTCFAADLTIMEEAAELVRRVTTADRPLPQFTSCCPAWVKFCETWYPEMLPNVSSAKSPIGMQGPTIKTYFAQRKGLDPAKIFNVALTPCTAKKFEIRRPEMDDSGFRDMDAVITTRELADWMRAEGVDWIVNGKTPPAELLNYGPVRGMGSKKKRAYVKQATLELKPGLPVTLVVVHGLAHVREVIARLKAGTLKATFIEVMACEGGCIGGGGQPRAKTAPYVSRAMRQARLDALYTDDARGTLRFSHENPEIQALYRDFYGKPLSPKAEKMLHTQYVSRAKDLG